MQSSVLRFARLGAVAIGSVAMVGASAGVASATSIRYGSTTSNPTSASPLVPSGNRLGSTAVVASSFTFPQQSGGPNPTTGSCRTGSIQGNVSGSNPGSPTVGFGPASLTLGAPIGSPSGCTDNGPLYDLQQIVLASPATFTVRTNGSNTGGSLAIGAPTFAVTVKQNSGTFLNCNLVPDASLPVAGVLLNGDFSAGGSPTVTFSNLTLKSKVTSGVCPSLFGDGSSSGRSSKLNVRFGPLTVTSGTGLGGRVGVFD